MTKLLLSLLRPPIWRDKNFHCFDGKEGFLKPSLTLPTKHKFYKSCHTMPCHSISCHAYKHYLRLPTFIVRGYSSPLVHPKPIAYSSTLSPSLSHFSYICECVVRMRSKSCKTLLKRKNDAKLWKTLTSHHHHNCTMYRYLSSIRHAHGSPLLSLLAPKPSWALFSRYFPGSPRNDISNFPNLFTFIFFPQYPLEIDPLMNSGILIEWLRKFAFWWMVFNGWLVAEFKF